MKKHLLFSMLTLCALLFATETTAQEKWIDVTANYITNPNFDDGTYDGWVFYRQGYGNTGSPTLRAGAMECWNDAFGLHQTISLPAGHYRLSANAFYRTKSNSSAYSEYASGTENIKAYLYAGDSYKVALKSLYSSELGEDKSGCWSIKIQNKTHYFANSMETAEMVFEKGGLFNQLEFDHAGGELQIGIYCDEWIQDCWCLWDNFKLEWYGVPTYVTSVSVSPTSETLTVGKKLQLTATVLPANATSQQLTWTSGNPSVATVDGTGVVKAIATGTSVITATAADGSGKYGQCTITVQAKQRPEGEGKVWIDQTDQYLVNPGFDNNSDAGWTYGAGKKVGSECMEFWNVTSDVYQVIPNLPAGWYRLSANALYRVQDNDQSFQNYKNGSEVINAVLYAGDDEQTLVSVYSDQMPDNLYSYSDAWSYWDWDTYTQYYFPNSMSTARICFDAGKYYNELEFEHAGGDLRIGIKNTNNQNNSWCIFDNFKLERYDNPVSITSIQLNQYSANLIVGEELQLTATILPENASNKKLNWISSKPAVATVDQNGLVKTLDKGQAFIRVRATDGSNSTSLCTVNVSRNKATASNLIINEAMISNVDQYISPAYNFDGWVELYNPSDQAVEISGLYISNEKNNLKKWFTPADQGTVPAGGYKLVWFDSADILHTNAFFDLDTDGDTLLISDETGKLITMQVFPAGMERVSYARTTDGSDEWKFTDTPTPGTTNNTATYPQYQVQLAAPVVDQPSQLFSEKSMSVNVQIPAGVTLRYTTDGTLPTLESEASTSGQFNISETTLLRLRYFADGFLASPVTSRTYIYRSLDYSLPSISVVTDPDFLYNNMIGIYVDGINGRPGNGQSTSKNYNMNWQRPVNFSYLDADGQMVFNQDVNMEICGGWSRANNPHSFKLKGNKEMGGDKKLPYPFFEAKPYIRNRTLQIRGGGNDNSSRFIDPAVQTIVQRSGIDIDGQSYQPVHLFLNGEYKGVMNMREPNNKHYVYANYGWDDDEIDQFEQSPDSGYVQMCGTYDSFDLLVNLSESADNSETYEEIRQLLDIDEYINYMACGFYLRRNDWIRNNVKGFRHQDNGRFRFVNYDLDGACGGFTFDSFMSWEYNYKYDQLLPSGTYIYQDNRLVTLFKNLLKNESFKRQFIDTYCVMGGSVFEATRCTEIIDELAARVYPAMQLTGMSPYGSANSLKSKLNSQNSNSISMLRNYSTFGLYNTMAQNVTLQSNVEGASLYVNGVKIPTGYFNGNLFAPMRLKAEAPGGYQFLGWTSADGSNTETTLLARGSRWFYYDQGSLDGTSWNQNTYSPGMWIQNYAPFGYGTDNVYTTMSYGGYNSNKYPTYYFRTSLTLDNAPATDDVFTMNYTIDDGFIVYVNGTEAGRYNMPSGSVGFNTYSTTYAHDNPDNGSIQLPANLFRKGSNLIAVEVHNNSASSSDIYFDADITLFSKNISPTDYYSTEAEIDLPTTSTVSLTAYFKSLTQAERTAAKLNPVRINEVSASNDTYINEYIKKADWVELYNTTDEEIDVEGMYLSDNETKLTKYRISAAGTNVNTKIPAHGYMLIWCDKENTTDQAIHASFKIGAEGDVLFLTAADKSWTDTLAYPAHDARTTIGRYPDGASEIYSMNVATIGKQNMLTSYAQREENSVATGITKPVFISAANGFRIRYAGGTLVLKSDEAVYASVEVFTASGQSMMKTMATMKGGVGFVSVDELPHGFYIARAVDADGNRVSCKFTK